MSNVSRHMQSCQANGSAVKRRVVLRECAVRRNAVGWRKSQLERRLCRAVRPAAAGAPIVEASPDAKASIVPGCPSFGGQRTGAQARARVRRSARPWSRVFNTQSNNTRSLPWPCEYATPAPLRSCAAAGIGRAAGGGVGSIRCMQRPQALRSRNRRAVCEQNNVTANPSIERTSKRLRLFVAAHVER
jgi:hypothetical protein